MRKHQQNQILEILKTIESAQDENLFADCQEGAIAAGEFIEGIAGEGTETVTLLEEYCDLVYKAHLGEIGQKPLKRQLIKIRNSVNFELKPDKIEMAFISYKASMSDSLETIYLAAKEDPNCDAYWIPIPYDTKKTDGTVKETHFEGADCYPDYLECVDWQKYDIEARRPDVIFTFAPYDAGNIVSSVHPDFYCERLKNFTDMLVYVPYFLLMSDPGHFALIAGCIYANKVIVQSDNVRKKYIYVYEQSYSDNFGKAEEKFVALGSPKFDKTINTKRNDCDLPDKWEELIDSKKVVLYNTSINSILQESELCLKKIKHVLETFRNRSDVALWWRPHPLSESTYKSMRANLADEYAKIVSDYRTEGFGIYDDTADLHRAIAYSDAYYGDIKSSLIIIYDATGKPIMYKNVEILGERKNSIPLLSFCADEDSYWALSTFSAIFKIDKKSREVKYMASVPGEKGRGAKYTKVIKHREKLYFSPSTPNSIGIYDIILNSFTEIPLLNTEDTEPPKFGHVEAYGDYVFFVGFNHPAIVRYNTVTKDLDYYTDWVAPIEKKSTVSELYLFNGCAVDEKLYLPAAGADAVVEFNMETCTSKVHMIENENNNYRDICFDGEDFWILSNKKYSVVRWNPSAKTSKIYSGFPKKLTESGVGCFYGIEYLNGHIWLFSEGLKIAIKFNVATENVELAKEFDLSDGKPTGALDYYISEVVQNNLLAYSDRRDTFIEYNAETGEVQCDSFKATDADAKKIKEDAMDVISYSRENDFIDLECFLDWLSKTEQTQKKVDTPGDSGKKIYDYILSEIMR